MIQQQPPSRQLTQLQLLVAINAALAAAGFIFEEDVDCHAALQRRLTDALREGALPDDPREWFDEELRLQLRDLAVDVALAAEGECYRLQRALREELIQEICVARDLVAEARLAPADVAAMLTEAGAPQPEDPACIVRLASACLTMAMRHQHYLALTKSLEHIKETWRAWREAQTQLRRLTPEIIDHSKMMDGLEFGTLSPRRERIGRLRSSQLTKGLQRFNRELEKLELPEGPGVPDEVTARWHDHVLTLWEIYRETVDPRAGWTRRTAAVKFIRKALARAYPKAKITTGTIEVFFSAEDWAGHKPRSRRKAVTSQAKKG